MGRRRHDWRAPIRARMKETGESFQQAWSALRGRPFGTHPKDAAGIPTAPFHGPREVRFLGLARGRVRRGKCPAMGRFRESYPGRRAHVFSQWCILPNGHAHEHFNGDPSDPLRWEST